MTCGDTQTGGIGPRPWVRCSVVTRPCPPLGEQKRPPPESACVPTVDVIPLFEKALEAVAAYPERYPLCDNRHRFFLLKRSPFQIIYR